MKEVVIVSAVRTPIGSIGGTLKNTLPEKLLATAYEGAIEKAGISKDMFDEVIAGQAKQTTDEMCIRDSCPPDEATASTAPANSAR